MKRFRYVIAACAISIGVLAAASIASGDVSAPEPTESTATDPALKEVEVTTPLSIVTADGDVVYAPEFFEAMEQKESSLAPQSAQRVGCVANFICTYFNQNFINPQVAIECAFAGNVGLAQNGHSARNRCGNKTNYLRVNGSVIACMNPGGDRPSPGGFNQVYVLVNYGAFC